MDRMDWRSATSNPEFEWYQERLHKERHSHRTVGGALMALTVCALVVGSVLVPFPNTLMLIAFIAVCCILFVAGASDFVAGRQPVTDEEVQRLRRQERIRLFRLARGILPWRYRIWARCVEMFLALLCLTMALEYTVLAAANKANWFLGGFYLLIFFYLLLDNCYLKPRRAKQLVIRSAAELSSHLNQGEHSPINSTDRCA